jgi:hypothetical protein
MSVLTTAATDMLVVSFTQFVSRSNFQKENIHFSSYLYLCTDSQNYKMADSSSFSVTM